jgi:hypothetical protein
VEGGRTVLLSGLATRRLGIRLRRPLRERSRLPLPGPLRFVEQPPELPILGFQRPDPPVARGDRLLELCHPHPQVADDPEQLPAGRAPADPTAHIS